MRKVRVLVGTRKGAFILTSDGKREQEDGPWQHDPHRILAYLTPAQDSATLLLLKGQSRL